MTSSASPLKAAVHTTPDSQQSRSSCQVTAKRVRDRIKIVRDVSDLRAAPTRWLVLDTEFTRLPYRMERCEQWLDGAHLLSVGITDLDGAYEAYWEAEVGEGLQRASCPFVRENVLPQLQLGADALPTPQALVQRLSSEFDTLCRRPTVPLGLITTSVLDYLILSRCMNRFRGLRLVVMADDRVRHEEHFLPEERQHNAISDARALARAIRAISPQGAPALS